MRPTALTALLALALAAACSPSERASPEASGGKRSAAELFPPGAPALEGPFAGVDLHAPPDALRTSAPDLFEQRVRLEGYEPPLFAIAVGVLDGQRSEKVTKLAIDAGRNGKALDEALRSRWGAPAWHNANGSDEGTRYWLNPAKRIRARLFGRIGELQFDAYVPAAELLGAGPALRLGGETEVLGARVDALAAERGPALRRLSWQGRPRVFLELPPTEYDSAGQRVDLDLDAAHERVVGYRLRLVDPSPGTRIRALLEAKWGAPARVEAEPDGAWNLHWEHRHLRFSHGAADVTVRLPPAPETGAGP